MSLDITVVIPTIPPRSALLRRALASVSAQSLPAAAVAVCQDLTHAGAGPTRQRALDMVRTPWVAFLDDDDELLPDHLAKLAIVAEATSADVVISWFDVIGGTDPFPMNRHAHFVPGQPMHAHGITGLVRTRALLREGGRIGFRPRIFGVTQAEDAMFWDDLAANGARFHQIPDVTWLWHHDSGNTSGLPDRW